MADIAGAGTGIAVNRDKKAVILKLPAAPLSGISASLHQACGETGDPLEEWGLS